MDEALRNAALDYHEFPEPGKISVTPTKAMVNQRDLALAYSPASPRRVKKLPVTPPPQPSTPRVAIWWR
jgi:malic enzyme